MKQLKIEVKHKHIKHGVQRLSSSCAIALAASEAGLGPRVSVAPDGLRVYDDSDYAQIQLGKFKLSKKAISFIKRFDNSKDVKPATFIITGSKAAFQRSLALAA